jgi:hypothetical protein
MPFDISASFRPPDLVEALAVAWLVVQIMLRM